MSAAPKTSELARCWRRSRIRWNSRMPSSRSLLRRWRRLHRRRTAQPRLPWPRITRTETVPAIMRAWMATCPTKCLLLQMRLQRRRVNFADIVLPSIQMSLSQTLYTILYVSSPWAVPSRSEMVHLKEAYQMIAGSTVCASPLVNIPVEVIWSYEQGYQYTRTAI